MNNGKSYVYINLHQETIIEDKYYEEILRYLSYYIFF